MARTFLNEVKVSEQYLLLPLHYMFSGANQETTIWEVQIILRLAYKKYGTDYEKRFYEYCSAWA